MPVPRTKKLAKPSPKTQKEVLPTPADQAVITDRYGIEYLGDEAKVTVTMSIKLSRNYNSVGAEAGIEFRTKVTGVEQTIQKALQKVRDCMKSEVDVMSKALDKL